jgi:integrase
VAGRSGAPKWTIAQLRAFLATAQQHRLFAVFHVAAYTGARRGELLNLRWKDIDLDGKKITITGSTAVIAGERINGTTKSGRTRVVSVDDETVAVLRQRKADQAAEQLKAGESWRGTKDGYVFTTGWGEPICPDTVTSLMTKLIRASMLLPHARLHDLRHLHATTLQVSGVAAAASFSRSGERTLPAVQRAALGQARSHDDPGTMRDLGCHHPVASDRTMMQPVRLQRMPA